MTNRLREALVALGLATSAQVSEWLAPSLGMLISAPTLLRRLRAVACPPPKPVHILAKSPRDRQMSRLPSLGARCRAPIAAPAMRPFERSISRPSLKPRDCSPSAPVPADGTEVSGLRVLSGAKPAPVSRKHSRSLQATRLTFFEDEPISAQCHHKAPHVRPTAPLVSTNYDVVGFAR